MNVSRTLSLLALTTSAAFSGSALAQHDVSFEGRLLDSICTGVVAGDAGTVTLTPVLASDLSTINAPANVTTEFPVALTGCDTATANYQVNFSHSSVVNGRLPNTSGTGQAEGVSLLLVSTANEWVDFTPAVDTRRLPLSQDPGADISGSGVVNYRIRYFREDQPLVPGKVSATATMTLTFL